MEIKVTLMKGSQDKIKFPPSFVKGLRRYRQRVLKSCHQRVFIKGVKLFVLYKDEGPEPQRTLEYLNDNLFLINLIVSFVSLPTKSLDCLILRILLYNHHKSKGEQCMNKSMI